MDWSNTLEELSYKLEFTIGIEADNQKIFFNGQELTEDSTLLVDYGVYDHDIVVLKKKVDVGASDLAQEN